MNVRLLLVPSIISGHVWQSLLPIAAMVGIDTDRLVTAMFGMDTWVVVVLLIQWELEDSL